MIEIPEDAEIGLAADARGHTLWLWRERQGDGWSSGVHMLVIDQSADENRPAGTFNARAADVAIQEWAIETAAAQLGVDVDSLITGEPTPAPGVDLRAELESWRQYALAGEDGPMIYARKGSLH